MATTLGKNLVYGAPSTLQLWLAESNNIADQAVFLVRTGLGAPAFARVCTSADMYNYPSNDDSAPGWYRSSGLEVEVTDSELMGKYIAEITRGLEGLDAFLEASASAEAPESITIPLRLYRTGNQIGTLNVEKYDASDSVQMIITVTFTDADVLAAVPNAVFKVSHEDFHELLGIRTVEELDDSSTSAQDFEVSITVWISKEHPELEGPFLEAIATDIEDLCSYAVTVE